MQIYNEIGKLNIYRLWSGITICLLLIMSFDISAQVIFEENFDDGLPSDWESTFNEPGQGWLHGDETTLSSQYFTFSENVFAGNAFMGANDDGCMPDGEDPSAAVNCDSSMDYLITPSIDLSDYSSVVLSFNAFYTGAYSSLLNIDISSDGGESWDENIFEVEGNMIWMNHFLYLNQYTGLDNVKIRFHHDDNGGTTNWASGAGIDDVKIMVLDNDLGIKLKHKIIDYSMFPISQLGEDGFGEIIAEVINYGVDQTNVTATVSIDSIDFSTTPISLVNMATYTSEAIDIGENTTTQISLGSDFEVENAHYVFRTSVNYDEIDEDFNKADNEHIHITQINEDFISRALRLDFTEFEDTTLIPKDYNLSLGGFSENDIRKAVSFEIFEASYIEQVNISIQNPEGLTRIGIFESDPDSSPTAEPLYESAFFDPADFAELTADQINTVPVPINCPYLLEPGKYWLSVYERADPDIGLIYSTHYSPLNQSVYLNSPNFTDEWLANPYDITPLIDVALSQELNMTSPATIVTLSQTENTSNLGIIMQAAVDNDDPTTASGYCNIIWTINGEEINNENSNSLTYEFSEFTDYEVCVNVESLDGTILQDCIMAELICDLAVNSTSTPSSISLEVENGSGNYEYNWSNDDNTSTINNLEEETEYTVTITDGVCTEELSLTTEACDLEAYLDDFEFEYPECYIHFYLDIDNSFATPSDPANHNIIWTDINDSIVGTEETLTICSEDVIGTFFITVTDIFGCEVNTEIPLLPDDIGGSCPCTTTNETIEGLANFEIYPNPTANEVTIDFDLDRNVDFQLTIFNVAGERVMETATQELNTFTQTFDLSEFANGVYMVQLTFDNKVMMERLMISK